MDKLLRLSFSKIVAATTSFAAAGKIGEGATGEVFRGELEGVPIAAKCLKLPPAATPEARAELRRRFDAELGTLTRFQHARIVKLLGFAEGDAPGAPYPMVLMFELLEEGSLADWLQGLDGSAPARGTLTAIERVDIALGASQGLAYLHGLTDEAEAEGGAAGGGGAAGPTVLHRDVKSANIGLTRLVKGGPLSPKILDCGLAKAIRVADGSAAAAAVGVSFTGGLVAGTVGYMAPEVLIGEYTLKSEIFAYGVVLLELFTGKRVDTRTAINVREAAEDAKEDGRDPVATLMALVDPVWPAAAAHALAAFILSCLQSRPARRPADMAAVLAKLREVRALVSDMAPPLTLCGICLEDVPETAGVRCGGGHFFCDGCVQGVVGALADDPPAMAAVSGRVKCPMPCCSAQPWDPLVDLQLDKGTLVAFSRALRFSLFDGPAAKRAAEQALQEREAAARGAELALEEKARQLRLVIVDKALYLCCPRCGEKADAHDKDECNAATCQRCGASFCVLCLSLCANGRAAHDHLRPACPLTGGRLFDRPAFDRSRSARFLKALVAEIKGLSEEGVALQRAVVAELAKADLQPLGIEPEVVLRDAHVEVAAADGPKVNMPRLQNRELKVEDALHYLDEVKKEFCTQPKIYDDFLDLMKAFKAQSIDTFGVISRVKQLFKGNNKLILGFNLFLPDASKIRTEDVADDQLEISLSIAPRQPQMRTGPDMGARHQQLAPGQQPQEFDHAITYVTSIKQRFADDPDTYKSFLEILHAYQKDQARPKEQQRGIEEVLDKVSKLFADHNDLLEKFVFFLPDNVQADATERLMRLKKARGHSGIG